MFSTAQRQIPEEFKSSKNIVDMFLSTLKSPHNPTSQLFSFLNQLELCVSGNIQDNLVFNSARHKGFCKRQRHYNTVVVFLRTNTI